ncbi:nucleotidyltransferase family protein [Pelagibacterium sediminicola]|uniref:nucleotidyltransferase family protein n=1 Tax=Pelagibacterium sediminicola TaxID=2248761 RepID=UPI0013005814|nr:nucleotidyltransferase family protein [Pelagibacterium sediminicola]
MAVLAAGLSRRFGPDDKLMAPLDGRPLCDHIACTAAEFDAEVKIAICSPASAPTGVFAMHEFEVIENPHSETGLSSSLKLAVGRAVAHGLDGLVICLADMPFVTLAHLDSLRGSWLESGCSRSIASRASGSDSRPCPPAIFSAGAFRDLLATSGDAGARALIAQAATVEINASCLSDFDRPDDFRDLGAKAQGL